MDSKRTFTVVVIDDSTGVGRSFTVNACLDDQTRAHNALNRAFHNMVGALLDQLRKLEG